MDKISDKQDFRLLDYLDGKLSDNALQELKRELDRSRQLQERLNELRLIHRALAAGARLDSPSPLFVEKVMGALHTKTYPSSLSPKNGLLLLGGMVIAAGILAAMVGAGFFDQLQGMISIDTAPVQKVIKQSIPQALPSIPFNGKLIVKILIGLNLGLAFLILDRTVLRPFFQRRAGTLL